MPAARAYRADCNPQCDRRAFISRSRDRIVVAGEGRGMDRGHIARSLRRLKDPRFLTGQGRYVDDIDLPGQLHGIVLRSPYGHAAIGGIDTAAAGAMPGVRGVFAAADFDADGIGPLPCIAQVATVTP